jgi:hypothetical protein
MFLQHVFRRNVVVAAGVVLLLVLPLPGVCQDKSGQAEESPGTMEEVIVIGHKSLVNLKRDVYRAEDALYDIFNSFNTEDEFDIRCYKEAPTGSHIKRRVCRANFVGDLIAGETQRMMRGEPYIYPAAQIKKMEERMLAKMTEITLQQPEMLEALVKFTEAKQVLESERKRRCEGRFLICRRQ